MLRLRRISSDPELFKPIQFTDGLNLILGEKFDNSTARGRKVNGVGKTLSIEFIQFGLLKEFERSRLAKIPEDFLHENQTVTLELELGDREVRITRSFAEPARPLIAVDKGTPKIMGSLSDGIEFLSSMMFSELEATGPRPSFRDLLSLLARDEDSEFTDILKEGNYPARLAPHLYLLGIPLELHRELKRTRDAKKKAQALQKQFKERLTKNNEVTVAAALAALNDQETSVRTIAEALDRLEAEPALAAQQGELLGLEQGLSRARAKRQAINHELDQIAAVPNPEPISERDVQLLYNSFKAGLGDMIARELREVQDFKSRIETFQLSLVTERRRALTKKRAELTKQIRGFSRRYRDIVSEADKTGALRELKMGVRAAQQQAAEYYAGREAARNLRDAKAEVDDAKDTWNALSSELRKAIESLNSAVQSVEATILNIHEAIMGDRKTSFRVEANSSITRSEPVEITLRMRADGSHSVNRTKVFIYDWALLLDEGTRTRHPGFLLHDNLFDVDQDTLIRSLNFVHGEAEAGTPFQYILTLNRDKIENEERRNEIVFDVDKYARARFTKVNPFLRREYEEKGS